jgi:hypothetical protein
MNNNTFDRSSLRMSAMLLLVGQLLYLVITLLHTGGEANHHSTSLAAYADSATWMAVHVAQFACMAIMLAGCSLCFPRWTFRPERPDWWVDSVRPQRRRRWRCTASS